MAIRHAVFIYLLLAFGSSAAALELELDKVRADFEAQAVNISVIDTIRKSQCDLRNLIIVRALSGKIGIRN